MKVTLTFSETPAGDRLLLPNWHIRRNEPFFIVRCTWRSDYEHGSFWTGLQEQAVA
jgi:hypothetical protein